MKAEQPRDPWVVGGVALLGLLSVLVVLLYRSAPQSVAEASTQTWLAARPDAVAPHLARARERLEFARAQVAAGRDSLAITADSAAAESAWRARVLAEEPAQLAEATELWAEATLAWAAILQRQGTGVGLRLDDNETLRRALALVERVLTEELSSVQRANARTLRDEITRQLRPGPLEWLPQRR